MRRCPYTVVGTALLTVWAGGCGPGDNADVECRCTDDTDLSVFVHCADVFEVSGVRPETGNPFVGRVPDCPSGTRLFLREPTSPEAILFNIRDTFQGFSPSQFMDQLEENFLFVPDADGLELYREVFQPPGDYNPEIDRDTLWTRAQERRFANNVLDRGQFQRIEFQRWYEARQDERILHEDGLSETYIFQYQVEFTEPPREGVAGTVLAIKGRAEIDVTTPSAENPVWIVTRWRDFRDQASARQSWTELRAEFSQ